MSLPPARYCISGVILGAVLVVAALTTRYTTLIIGYTGGNLSYIHSVCDSGAGAFVRLMNAKAASRCSQADSYYLITTLLLVGGVLLIAAGGAEWAVGARKPAAPVGGAGS